MYAEQNVLRRISWELSATGQALVNSLLEVMSFPSLFDHADLEASFGPAFFAVSWFELI